MKNRNKNRVIPVQKFKSTQPGYNFESTHSSIKQFKKHTVQKTTLKFQAMMIVYK